MTILRKKKICIQCGLPKYIFSKGRCQGCANMVSIALKKGKKAEKKESISSLKKELDTIFSLFIRLRYADKEGMVLCYTSGKKMHWKKAQCGHFISRRHLGTRWDVINCQVQSVKENVFNQGNAPEFGRRLVADFGQHVVDKLFFKMAMPYKLDRTTLRWEIDQYNDQVRRLKEKLNITD